MNPSHTTLEELVERYIHAPKNKQAFYNTERWMHTNLKKDNAESILISLKKFFSAFFTRNVKRCQPYNPREFAVLASLLAAFMDCRFWAGFPPSSNEASWCELTLVGTPIYLIDVLLQMTTVAGTSEFAQGIYRRIFCLPRAYFKCPTNAVRLIALYKWASGEIAAPIFSPKDLVANYLHAHSLITWIYSRHGKITAPLESQDSSDEQVLQTIINNYELEDFVELLSPTATQNVNLESDEVAAGLKKNIQPSSKKLKKLIQNSQLMSKKKRVKDPALTHTPKQSPTDGAHLIYEVVSSNLKGVIDVKHLEPTVHITELSVLPLSGQLSEPNIVVETTGTQEPAITIRDNPEIIRSPLSMACDGPSCSVTATKVGTTASTFSKKSDICDQVDSEEVAARESTTVEYLHLSSPKGSLDTLQGHVEIPQSDSAPNGRHCIKHSISLKSPILNPDELFDNLSPQITQTGKASQETAVTGYAKCAETPRPKRTTLAVSPTRGLHLSIDELPPDENSSLGNGSKDPDVTVDQVQLVQIGESDAAEVVGLTQSQPTTANSSGRVTRQSRLTTPGSQGSSIHCSEVRRPSTRRQNSSNAACKVESMVDKSQHAHLKTPPTRSAKSPHVTERLNQVIDIAELACKNADEIQLGCIDARTADDHLQHCEQSTPALETTPVVQHSRSRIVHSTTGDPTLGKRKSTVRRRDLLDGTHTLNASNVGDILTCLQYAETQKSPVTTPIKRLSNTVHTGISPAICNGNSSEKPELSFPGGNSILDPAPSIYGAPHDTRIIATGSAHSVQYDDAQKLLSAVPLVPRRRIKTPQSDSKIILQRTSSAQRKALRRRGSISGDYFFHTSLSANPTVSVSPCTQPTAGRVKGKCVKEETGIPPSTAPETVGPVGSEDRRKLTATPAKAGPARKRRTRTPQSTGARPSSRVSSPKKKRLSVKCRSGDSEAAQQTPSGTGPAKSRKPRGTTKEDTIQQRPPYLLRGRTPTI
ncbi:hypothetical protein CSKR_201631 [Clonorchis sinensis]|uniref:Uncharacterized protein n=1 Tax=Clonorchis sinensis TaxID=79923 RepID=A0A8T1MSW9_CLOSI|nr:hypothetical protein CSKR_201631 [Clonorchis sinensis]